MSEKLSCGNSSFNDTKHAPISTKRFDDALIYSLV